MFGPLTPTAALAAAPTLAPAPTSAPTPVPSAAPTATAVPTATTVPTTAPTATPSVAVARMNSPEVRPDGRLSVTGTGQPGAVVELWANDTRLGKATVGSDGKWSFTGSLKPGEYQLKARTLDADGKTVNESEPQAVKVTAATPVPKATITPAPGIAGQVYVVKQGDWLTKLALQFYGDMNLYTLIVEGTNAKAAQDSSFTRITNPDQIEVGQKLWIPAR